MCVYTHQVCHLNTNTKFLTCPKIHKNPKFHEPCDLVGLEILTWSYNYQQRYSWITVISDSTMLLKTETDFSFILCRITDAGVYISCIWARQATPQQLELLNLAQGYLCNASKGYWHLPWYYHTFQISSTICVLWGLNPAQYPSGQLLMSLVLYFPLQNLVLCSHTDGDGFMEQSINILKKHLTTGSKLISSDWEWRNIPKPSLSPIKIDTSSQHNRYRG